jgi:hypothetical protein
MQKSISIELTELNNNIPSINQMLSNTDFATTSNWVTNYNQGSCGNLWVISSGSIKKTSTSNCSYFHQPVNLIEGQKYQVEFYVRNYNLTGALLLANHDPTGSNVTLVDNTIVTTNTANWKKVTKQWVQGASNTDKIRFYANQSTTIELDDIKLYKVPFGVSNVYGVLDATTSDDFPLALTFSVNDPSNIEARTGAYSKTFQIPATSNNNTVLKNFNIANSTLFDSSLYAKIPCRILVGNLFSLTGLFQLQDVVRINDVPVFYSCIFYGDNLGWSTTLEALYLSDMRLPNSDNLKLSMKNIVLSWDSDHSELKTNLPTTTPNVAATQTANTSPVVYPVAVYGILNASTEYQFGEAIQLKREQWELDYISNDPYNINQTGIPNALSVPPVNDWRPQIWIYKMMHYIFNSIGYKLSSNFIESDNFKKLLYATPNFLFNNPEMRYEKYSYFGNFQDSVACATPSLTNLKFYSGNIIYNIPASSLSPAQTGIINTNIFRVVGNLGATGSSDTLIRLSDGNCTFSTAAGSGRFQPDIGVIVANGNLMQQETTVELGGTSGIASYNYWKIGESGYYNINIANISYELTTFTNSWSGGSSSTYNADSKIIWVGELGIQTLLPADNTWITRTTLSTSGFEMGAERNANAAYTLKGTFPSVNYEMYLNKNEQVRIVMMMNNKLKVKNPNATALNITFTFKLYGCTSDTPANSNGLFSIEMINPEIPAFGCTYDLKDVLPNDQKQLDFIKGVAHAFNLQFNTVESEKTVYCEPYTSFYLPPKYAIDWTNKLDRGQDDTLSFFQTEFTRRLIFKYKTDDNDAGVKRMSETYFQGVGDNYPKVLDLPNTYPKGETIFENPFFAGSVDTQSTYMGLLLDMSKNFYTVRMATTAHGQPPQGYDFQPRMLLYRKFLRQASYPMVQGFFTENNTSFGTDPFYMKRLQYGNVQAWTAGSFPEYTTMASRICTSTFNDRYNFTDQFGLSYGNYWATDWIYPATEDSIVGNQIGKGLYQRYYQPMIDNLINNPKTRICYIDLKITDIINLDFRKLVYIDGVYYRLIKVIDYQPHLNIPTQVELHQWAPDTGSSLPQEGVWINNVGGGVNSGGGVINEDGSSPFDPIQYG